MAELKFVTSGLVTLNLVQGLFLVSEHWVEWRDDDANELNFKVA